MAAFARLPQLPDVASDLQNEASTATLTIDRDRAASFGISPAAIDATIYDAIGQRKVSQYFTQINSYYVVLEVMPALQRDPALFSKLYLTSPLTGQQVPLSAFVKLGTDKTAYLSITHQGQFPAVTLSFNLALGDAVDAINALQAQTGLQPSLTGSFQGTAQAFRDSLRTQPYLIAAALIALIGIILLIGIVKKNGIMMVDFALGAEREQGLSPQEAIRQACLLRFRPIMMTAMCALLGGLPLMLGHGAGSELHRPLGYAMVGGLLLSQALTLFTTPVVYLYLDRIHHAWVRRRQAGRARLGEAAA